MHEVSLIWLSVEQAVGYAALFFVVGLALGAISASTVLSRSDHHGTGTLKPKIARRLLRVRAEVCAGRFSRCHRLLGTMTPHGRHTQKRNAIPQLRRTGAALIDEYTREVLAIRVKRRLNAQDVLETLADAMILPTAA